MKKIYVIFSATDLKIGQMIRFVTRNRYNHCSICLSEDLKRFYSFSRVYRSNPLIGGFVVESPLRYTLSSRTGLKIVEVEVTDEAYRRVKELIGYMGRNAFTCAEFTREILKAAGIAVPKKANIYEMERCLEGLPTTEGLAVDILGPTVWGEDRYLEHIGKKKQAVQIAKRFGRLVAGAHLSPP